MTRARAAARGILVSATALAWLACTPIDDATRVSSHSATPWAASRDV